MSLSIRTAITAGVLGACLLATQAFAAPPGWTVDKAASKLGFKSSFSGMPFEGGFRQWDAQIAFDPKDLAGSKVNVVIQMASATTGDTSRDQSLPSDDWFATSQFPRATFTSTSFRSLGGDRYQAAGTLTIRGKSVPVVLPFTLDIAGDVARMNGQVAINRTAFGVGQGEFETGDSVPLEVTVLVSITAKRAG
jgi:polyisoprenoid-binding protein YceI